MQIHDELLFEVREQDLHTIASIIRNNMENSVMLKVPLQVKLSVGPNWADLVPYDERTSISKKLFV